MCGRVWGSVGECGREGARVGECAGGWGSVGVAGGAAGRAEPTCASVYSGSKTPGAIWIWAARRVSLGAERRRTP